MVLKSELDKRLMEIENKIAQIEMCLQTLASHISCLTNKVSQFAATPPELTTSEKFDFEQIYKLYPRKLGKAKGLKLCAKIKSLAEFQELEKAVLRFIQYHQRKNTEIVYIPHFSTFMSSWRDWLDPSTGEEYSMSYDDQAVLLATKIVGSLSKFGGYAGAEAKTYLGHFAWEAVKKRGGWYSICSEANNNNIGTIQAQLKNIISAMLSEKNRRDVTLLPLE